MSSFVSRTVDNLSEATEQTTNEKRGAIVHFRHVPVAPEIPFINAPFSMVSIGSVCVRSFIEYTHTHIQSGLSSFACFVSGFRVFPAFYRNAARLFLGNSAYRSIRQTKRLSPV